MEIKIIIKLDGSVETRVVGGCGKSCKDATKVIRDAMGVTTEDRNLPEYYAEERAGEHNKASRS